MMDITYSINVQLAAEKAISLADILEGTDIVVNIIVNIVVIIGGILGLNYIIKLKEKQMDSAFSYLTRLNVRIKYFERILNKHEDEIMNRFLIRNCRREASAANDTLVDNTIKLLVDNAQETLKFLRDENNQMPAQKGWTTNINLFINFLMDCEQLKNDSYFKWVDEEEFNENKEKYCKDIKDSMNSMLNMINNQQIYLENKMFKKSNRSGKK